MNKTSYAINGILGIAVIVLFVLFFSNGSKVQPGGKTTVKVGASDSVLILPIAYVDVDSLLANYEFATVSGERLMNKFKSSNNSVAQKQQQLEKEAADFQRKLDNNAFLSQERAQQESERLQKMNMDLQKMAQRLQGELAREEQKINEEIADSVRVCLEAYNQTANYEIILSNKGMDNVLIAKDTYDITGEILEMLNNRYKSSLKK